MNMVLLNYNLLLIYIFMEILTFTFSLICWIFFFPLLNIIGIELGRWIALIPNIIIIRIYCAKYFSVDKLCKQEFWNLFIVFILIFISFFVVSMQIPMIFMILIFIIISGSYIVFLFSTRIIQKKDIKYILDNINPKKMIKYIQEETLNHKN